MSKIEGRVARLLSSCQTKNAYTKFNRSGVQEIPSLSGRLEISLATLGRFFYSAFLSPLNRLRKPPKKITCADASCVDGSRPTDKRISIWIFWVRPAKRRRELRNQTLSVISAHLSLQGLKANCISKKYGLVIPMPTGEIT